MKRRTLAGRMLAGALLAAGTSAYAGCSSEGYEPAPGSAEQAEATNRCGAGLCLKPTTETCTWSGREPSLFEYLATGGAIDTTTNPETIQCTYRQTNGGCTWQLAADNLGNPACIPGTGICRGNPPATPPTNPSWTTTVDIPNGTILDTQAKKDTFCQRATPRTTVVNNLATICTRQLDSTNYPNNTASCCTERPPTGC